MTLLDRVRTRTYNCAHYAAEVWAAETGEDITPALTGFLAPRHDRQATPLTRKRFVRLQEPKTPCIVLFRRPRAEPHVGVYLRGAVLHLEAKMPKRDLIADIVAANGFKTVTYYDPR